MNHDIERPCILTCALSGVVADRRQCPAIPYTPEEYAAEARRAFEAGAAIVHIHARRPDGTPSYEVEDYRAISEAVAAECPVVINFSTGAVGIPVEKKTAPIQALRPAIGALNMGSMNYAKYHPGRKEFVFEFVFANPFHEIIAILRAMREAGTRPEMECFDLGHIAASLPLLDMGLLDPPLQYSLILGVLGGVPPTTRALVAMVDSLPLGANWQVIGIGRDQWRLAAAAIGLGGNVRVGLEDNFYLPGGTMARSNGELVEQAARMVRDQGRDVATVEECRRRLGIANRQRRLWGYTRVSLDWEVGMDDRAVILIVDDEEFVLNALERSLRLDGHEVIKCQEPLEAIEVLKGREVDVVISDHLMPQMKGLDLLQEAKRLRPRAIRILLTGHADLQLALRAINEGEVYRFFTKPWDDDTLRLDVRLALEQRRLRDENERLTREVDRQAALLKDLEARYPGITYVRRSETGAVIIDEQDL